MPGKVGGRREEPLSDARSAGGHKEARQRGWLGDHDMR